MLIQTWLSIPLGVPELMGPQPVGGDAAEHPLVERLQSVEPVLEILITGNHPYAHRGGLADLLGGPFGAHVAQALQYRGEVHQAAAMDLRESLDPPVEALELKTRIVLKNPKLQLLGIHRPSEP